MGVMSAMLLRKSSSAKTVLGNDWEGGDMSCWRRLQATLGLQVIQALSLAGRCWFDPLVPPGFLPWRDLYTPVFPPWEETLVVYFNEMPLYLKLKIQTQYFCRSFLHPTFLPHHKTTHTGICCPSTISRGSKRACCSPPGSSEGPIGRLHHCMAAHVLLEAGKSLENRSLEN